MRLRFSPSLCGAALRDQLFTPRAEYGNGISAIWLKSQLCVEPVPVSNLMQSLMI